MAWGNEISGMDGDVAFTGGNVMGIKEFTIDSEIDLGAYNNWDAPDVFERQLTGLRRWNVSVTADVQTDEGFPEAGVDGNFTGTVAAGYTWTGPVVLSRISNMVRRSADVVEATFELVGNGVLVPPA